MDKTKLLPVKSDDVFSENRFWEELFFRIGEGGSLRIGQAFWGPVFDAT